MKNYTPHIAALVGALLMGCSALRDVSLPELPTEPEAPVAGFVNPTIPPTTVGTNDQNFSLKKKDYDSTYRIAWPTYFANKIGDNVGSYSMIDGKRATFRGWDDDNGAKRPKYSISQRDIDVNGPVVCKLYSAKGVQLAETVAVVGRNVRLK